MLIVTMVAVAASAPWVFSVKQEKVLEEVSDQSSFKRLNYEGYSFQDEQFWELSSWGVSLTDFGQQVVDVSKPQKQLGANYRYAGRVVSGSVDNRVLISPDGEITRIEKGTESILGYQLILEDESVYLSNNDGSIKELPLFSSDYNGEQKVENK